MTLSEMLELFLGTGDGITITQSFNEPIPITIPPLPTIPGVISGTLTLSTADAIPILFATAPNRLIPVAAFVIPAWAWLPNACVAAPVRAICAAYGPVTCMWMLIAFASTADMTYLRVGEPSSRILIGDWASGLTSRNLTPYADCGSSAHECCSHATFSHPIQRSD